MPRTIVCGVDLACAAEAVADTPRWVANRLDARRVLVHAAGARTGKAAVALTLGGVQFGYGSRADVRLVDGSLVASSLLGLR